ncbi:hypothetical protein [Streptomyces erythrochromogenes]
MKTSRRGERARIGIGPAQENHAFLIVTAALAGSRGIHPETEEMVGS